MSKQRQLQQEIEKKLTLVDEGYTSFHQTLKKIQLAVTQTQKERYETELKKEIKKLQRHRESLRTFENQDSRYKSKINDARRKIEELMELYKQTEREAKTKAFSKEGLLITPKPDPHEEEKEEMREMVKTLQGNFQGKINEKTAELEKIRNSKNRNNYNQEEIIKQLKCLQYHLEKLELVLRSIENDYASLEQIWSLHDTLEAFLQTEELADEQEIEQRYKELNLPSKSLQHFPMLSEEEPDLQKKVVLKKPEAKPVVANLVKPEVKPVEKGWNSKEALIKITGKVERVPEDLTDDEVEPERVESEIAKKHIDQGFSYQLRNEDRAKSSLQMVLSPYPGHASYPRKPLCSHNLFKKFELDTLFFIFYHQHGTYQQFLAAKELKAKGWIYHKKFQTWFQRSGDPKLTAQDREKGTFLYFDYETSWSQRRKADFEFEYTYLENDLL